MYAKVKDRRTGVLKTVMAKAYQLIPHRYDLLGYIDEDGNPVEVAAPTPHVKKSPARAVAPAATKAKLTREDLDRMNAEAMERAKKNKAELDSLKVPEGYGLNPATGPDQETAWSWVNPGAKEDANVIQQEFSKRILDEVDKQIAAIPPRPSATKVKSVKTFKK